MSKINLEDIIIGKKLVGAHPRQEKLDKYRRSFAMTGKQVKKIILNEKNEIVDGLIQYLVLKENGVKEADCIKKGEVEPLTTYVYGKHINGWKQQEYVWRVPAAWIWMQENIRVGDRILCNTKYGCKKVKVTRVEALEKCPINCEVKLVARCSIRRNGVEMYECGIDRNKSLKVAPRKR